MRYNVALDTVVTYYMCIYILRCLRFRAYDGAQIFQALTLSQQLENQAWEFDMGRYVDLFWTWCSAPSYSSPRGATL